jgi:hypothetical protein
MSKFTVASPSIDLKSNKMAEEARFAYLNALGKCEGPVDLFNPLTVAK